ncbi:MAG: hypothetical protein E7545_05490 [Ruminococcaceae bacterium]|nr:hypothetical protein [Oscillospiraceae bacterium]
MSKKDYLSQYLLQQKKINRLNCMIKLNPENRKKYIQAIKKSEGIRREIEAKISAVDDDVLREILFLKYTCGKSLMEISYIINYSRRHTERLHIKALEKFKL